MMGKRTTDEGSGSRKSGATDERVTNLLARQRGACCGCLTPITPVSLRVDYDPQTSQVRGLLCYPCFTALVSVKDTQSTLRRLMAYLERDIDKRLVYVGGSLKNPRIPEVGNLLRSHGYDAMDEWYTPGELADDNWQAYEKQRGRGYVEALRGRAATNTLLFDCAYIDLSDAFVTTLPAGKSAMLELGYAKGRGIPTILFTDGHELDRYEVMPGVADVVARTETELLLALGQVILEVR